MCIVARIASSLALITCSGARTILSPRPHATLIIPLTEVGTWGGGLLGMEDGTNDANDGRGEGTIGSAKLELGIGLGCLLGIYLSSLTICSTDDASAVTCCDSSNHFLL